MTDHNTSSGATDAMFSGGLSFMRCRESRDYKNADIAVLGIPFDCAGSNRSGSRFGPRGVRVASTMISWERPYGWGDTNVFDSHTVIDAGDLDLDYAMPKAIHETIMTAVDDMYANDCTPFAIGGDHYITYPLIESCVKKHGPVALVHFDAHTDTWQDDDPERIDHGTQLYKAIKGKLINVDKSIQVGIRTVNDDTMGIKIIDAPEYHKRTPTDVAEQIKDLVGNAPVYLTFDIDCLDPAYAPGTGTPVAGGLSTAQALETLRALAGINLVGMDMVEVSPPFDHAEMTALAGASIATEILQLYSSR